MSVDLWDGQGALLVDTSARTVAVAAQVYGLGVLHFDHHFDRLGDLLGVRTLWIADPSA